MTVRPLVGLCASVLLAAGCAGGGGSSPPGREPASPTPSTRVPTAGRLEAGGHGVRAEGHGDGDGGWSGGPTGGVTPVVVVRAVDGDTIEVRAGGRTFDVRLIGVDTPETVHPFVPVECYGPQASRFTHRHLDGRRVYLEYDVEGKDRYGRDLAYVWLGKAFRRMFNETLVRRGFATAYPYPPNTRYADRFAAEERRARRRHVGLWGPCGGSDTPLAGGSTSGGGGGGGRTGRCDPSYPSVCIPPPPPDLDCADVKPRNFVVRAPDPHHFDGNGDGRGCEV